MKSKKVLISNILVCIGILLIIAYAFIPVINIDQDKFYDETGEISSDILGLVGVDISGDFASTIIKYAAKEGGAEDEFKEIKSIRLIDCFLPGEKIAAAMGADTSDSEWKDDSEWKLFKTSMSSLGLAIYVFPIVILIAAAVMFSINMGKKIALGMVITDAVYLTIFNIGLWRFLSKWLENALYYADEILKEYVSLSIWIFPIVFAGIAICIVCSVLTVIWENSVNSGAQKAGAYLIGIGGQFAGSRIPLEDNRPVVIGREGQFASVVLDSDAKVSRRHCEVVYEASSGNIYITDYSSNGTRLGDGTRLPKNTRMPLNRGTVIVLSPETKFTVN